MGCPSFLRHPHSNQRAELGVKQPKRIIRENVDGSGILSTDRFSRAIMNYRNTPCRDMKMSPAQKLFNMQLTDHLPIQVQTEAEGGVDHHTGEKRACPVKEVYQAGDIAVRAHQGLAPTTRRHIQDSEPSWSQVQEMG